MSLSPKAREILTVALANAKVAAEVADAIDAAQAEASQAAAVAPVDEADADATYGAPEQALLNECKAQINAVIASLQAAGLMAE
jgi:hypothetical protein